MGGNVSEAITPDHAASLLRKARCKPALPSRICGHVCGAIASVRTQGLRVRTQRIRLCGLLPAESTLLTCVPDLVATLSSLRSRQTSQVTILALAQCTFSTKLLAGIQLLGRSDLRA